MNRIRSALRHHSPFLILMPLIIILMTWPTAIRVFDRDGFWLVQRNIDSNMLFWDAWYFEQLISDRADYFHTDLLFHPQGVSLAFHNFSLPHMIVMAALKTIFPPANAFNLTYLLLTFLNAAAGYVYLHYLFRDKWIALFGAVVFGTSAFIISRPAQPNISFIATIPLALYFLHRGLLECRPRFMVIAGAVIGATAFIGMYTLVCLLIMVGLYIIGFSVYRWRNGAFWLSVLLLLSVSAAIVLIRVYPMISDPAGLSGALAKNRDFELGTDLMWYFVNYKHPVLTSIMHRLLPIVDRPGWDRIVYLGYVPLTLIGLALWKRESRRLTLPWVAAALVFLILRLGSTLTVNSVNYEHFLLPKYFLEQAFPQVFRPFWTPDIFHGGALLPFAVAVCIGLRALLKSVKPKLRFSVIVLLAGAVAFEYYQMQRPFVLPEGRLDFISWLEQEDDQERIHLINLPMGGQNSKVYAFFQTYNGYPHAEGRPTRTPPSAFEYIEDNLLLSSWRAGKTYNCLPGNLGEFRAAQAQLLDDGFTHIVLHRDRISRETVAANFVNIPAAFRDQFVSIYRVEDLDESCNISAFLSPEALHSLKLVTEKAIIPLHAASLLIIHPYETVDAGNEENYSAILYNWRGFTPLRFESGADGSPSDASEESSVQQRALNANSAILFIYDAQATDAALVDTYRSRLSLRHNSCGRISDTGAVVIEYFLYQEFPCELVLSDAPLAARYSNDMQLGNLVATPSERELELFLVWTRLPAEGQAVSIQFFDESGSRVYGQDFVIHEDAPARHRIDLTYLEPGTYFAQLIVYNYETGASVPGTILSSQTRFERELEFARISVDSEGAVVLSRSF